MQGVLSIRILYLIYTRDLLIKNTGHYQPAGVIGLMLL